jgi:hypothetical protein
LTRVGCSSIVRAVEILNEREAMPRRRQPCAVAPEESRGSGCAAVRVAMFRGEP